MKLFILHTRSENSIWTQTPSPAHTHAHTHSCVILIRGYYKELVVWRLVMETGGGSGLMLAATTPLFLPDPRPCQYGADKEKEGDESEGHRSG